MAISIVPLLTAARSNVVVALADQQRQQVANHPTWQNAARLGQQLGLIPRRIASQVSWAEALGIIASKDDGPRITLTSLGWKLFGISSDGRKGTSSSGNPAESPDLDDQPGLVAMLAGWPGAVVLVQDLADQFGLDVESLWDEVLEQERRGSVETWLDHPAGPAVILAGATAADSA